MSLPTRLLAAALWLTPLAVPAASLPAPFEPEPEKEASARDEEGCADEGDDVDPPAENGADDAGDAE
ncbi:MAG: hypothetical protein HY901_34095 [Deltaproteobacteria bacterium]|nr:hypothetical protein [Deltaproteobacteria bacterium]